MADATAYSRIEIDSIKLRGLAMRRMSRTELFSRLQLIRTVEPLTKEAYRRAEMIRWRDQTDDEPHGRPWHVSFHGSKFPGNQAFACPRQQLYILMDFIGEGPFTRKSRTIMSAGKAIEVELVGTWNTAEVLLSAPEDAEVQTAYKDPETWLTATVDAVVLPYRWKQPLPIEVKSKENDVIKMMRAGGRGPDDAHVRQIKVEVAFVRIIQRELWPDLELADHGVIYYLSRDNPEFTAEFRVDYDAAFWKMGLERLKEWRQFFIDDTLPQAEDEDDRKRHPMGFKSGWRFTNLPCAWCEFKKDVCRPDHNAGITKLSESKGVSRTKSVRPDYDPEDKRKRVFDEWEGDK